MTVSPYQYSSSLPSPLDTLHAINVLQMGYCKNWPTIDPKRGIVLSIHFQTEIRRLTEFLDYCHTPVDVSSLP